MVYDAGQNSEANTRTWPAPGWVSSGRCRHPSTRTCSPCPPPGATDRRQRALPRPDLRGHPQQRATACDRRAVLTHSPELHDRQSRGFDGRPWPRPAANSTTCRPPWPAAPPAATGPRCKPRSSAITRASRWVRPGHPRTLTGDHPGRPAAHLPRRRPRPRQAGKTRLRQARPVHRPRRLAHRRRRGRLPLPVRGRSRVPTDEGPPRRLLRPDAPLDRLQNPGPRLLLRPRVAPSPT